jgi:hypothetical protein
MIEEITDGDDYADWIKWVANAEESRQIMHESTHNVLVPLLLQQHCPQHDFTIPMILQTIQVKMATLIVSPVKSLCRPVIMNREPDGRRFVNESRSTPI